MPLQQPSPDRLIFTSDRRPSIARRVDRIIDWIALLTIVSACGCLLYFSGLLLGKFLSHSFAIFLAKPLDYVPYLSVVCTIIFVFSALSAFFCYYLTTFALFSSSSYYQLELRLPDLEYPDRGELSLVRMNIFGKKKTIQIPLDKVLDIRIAYTDTYPNSIQILLVTSIHVKPILVGNSSYSFSEKRIKKMLQSTVAEIETIREFLNLPRKPSYLVDEKGDLSTTVVYCRGNQKILEDTQNVFRFISIFEYFSQTWNFDCQNSYVKLQSRYLGCKYNQKIEVASIKYVCIKRESYGLYMLLAVSGALLSPNASKNLAHLRRDRYSLILVLKDGATFKCPNNYLRVFSSTDLCLLEEYADRLRSHLNLPEKVNAEIADRHSAVLI
jgi:hypothetical protein